MDPYHSPQPPKGSTVLGDPTNFKTARLNPGLRETLATDTSRWALCPSHHRLYGGDQVSFTRP